MTFSHCFKTIYHFDSCCWAMITFLPTILSQTSIWKWDINSKTDLLKRVVELNYTVPSLTQEVNWRKIKLLLTWHAQTTHSSLFRKNMILSNMFGQLHNWCYVGSADSRWYNTNQCHSGHTFKVINLLLIWLIISGGRLRKPLPNNILLLHIFSFQVYLFLPAISVKGW